MSRVSSESVWQTDLSGLEPPKRGKVRDIYDLGDTLLIVACDRISAYDHVLQPGIPGKGKILNQLTNFWFEYMKDMIPNHLVATDPRDFPAKLAPHRDILDGRAVLVEKAKVIPFECVARGYLAGSAYREVQKTGEVCGIPVSKDLARAERLPEAIFTPATKAEQGEHDENIDYDTLVAGVGEELAEHLRDVTLALYTKGTEHASKAGMLLADTKFEFGHVGETVVLIDEVLTPDSSRYWEADAWSPGTEPVSFDKQFVRNWLDETAWDKQSPPPELSAEVVEGTLSRYLEAFRRITGEDPVL